MAVTPTQAPAPAAAAGPEIKDPTLTQQLMLDAPYVDDLYVRFYQEMDSDYNAP